MTTQAFPTGLYVDVDGNNAPSSRDGLEFGVWMAVEARLNTLYGRQLMRPDYGLDLSAFVGRNLPDVQYAELRRRVRAALDPLRPSSILTEPDGNLLGIRVVV